jgi:hypothetical protein
MIGETFKATERLSVLSKSLNERATLAENIEKHEMPVDPLANRTYDVPFLLGMKDKPYTKYLEIVGLISFVGKLVGDKAKMSREALTSVLAPLNKGEA